MFAEQVFPGRSSPTESVPAGRKPSVGQSACVERLVGRHRSSEWTTSFATRVAWVREVRRRRSRCMSPQLAPSGDIVHGSCHLVSRCEATCPATRVARCRHALRIASPGEATSIAAHVAEPRDRCRFRLTGRAHHPAMGGSRHEPSAFRFRGARPRPPAGRARSGGADPRLRRRDGGAHRRAAAAPGGWSRCRCRRGRARDEAGAAGELVATTRDLPCAPSAALVNKEAFVGSNTR